MKNQAFTLIELLVVILIIGVLASIAFAQYQKSVLKSRFSTLMPIAKALNDGQEMFFLSHGKYADKLENLDVEIAAGASGSTANINGNIITIGANNRHTYVKATKENFDNNLILFQSGSKYFPGEIHCEAKTGDSIANWLCKVALNGKEVSGANAGRSLTEGYTDYVIKGDGNGVFPKDWVNENGLSTKKNLMPGDTCTGTEDGYQCRELIINDGACYGKAETACARSTYINSYCEGTARLACSSLTEFYNSSCVGTKYATCGGKFYDSSCEGKGDAACTLSTFDNSVCIGNSSSACGGSTFKNGSICYAYVEGACGYRNGNSGAGIEPKASVYEDNACCSGEFCPSYAPKCDCDIDPNTGQHALSC